MYRNDAHLYYLLGAYAGLHCPVEQIKKFNFKIFFIGGIKKMIGIIFGQLSLDGILWCSIASCLSTLTCVIVILYLRKVLHAIINKVGNDRLKKMAVILIP